MDMKYNFRYMQGYILCTSIRPSILFCIANIEVSGGGVGFAKSHRDFVKDFMPQQEAFYPVFDAIFSHFSPFFNFFTAP